MLVVSSIALSYYIKNIKKLEFDKLDTIVNVPLVVNVWIVCHPFVVIVPPVELVDIKSLQSVAYDTTTTHAHPVHHTIVAALAHHPHPHHLFAAPAIPLPVFEASHQPSVPVPIVPPGATEPHQPQP